MSHIEDQSIKYFLDELASAAPTPGGGGVAALMGAQAAALVSMVCNLTIGKLKYAEVETQMQSILQQSEQLRSQFLAMLADDVAVFKQVMAAYGLPKQTETEQQIRSAAIQDALKNATDVPLVCAKAAAKVIALSKLAAELGNVNVVSDAGAATMAGFAALKTAALNVYVNTGAIKDQAFTESRLAELNQIIAESEAVAETVYQLVKAKL